MDEPLHQTFGVELEFVVKIPLKQHIDQRTGVEEPMARLLAAAGFAINDAGTLGSFDKWSIERDVSIKPEPNDNEGPDPRMIYFGVEVKSRILPVTQSSFLEIQQIVTIINTNFQILRNATTGLHVHVGNGQRGFPLRCLRNLAEIVIVFEHQIHSVHVDHRLDSSWCAPPSRLFDPREGPFHAVVQIEKIRDHDSFIELMNPDSFRFVAYNFLNLKKTARSKQTIEFRQHEGTMDADSILAWAEFTTGIVEYCYNVPPDRLMTLLLTFATDEKFSILNLLQIIGKPHLIGHYRPILIHRERQEIPMKALESEVPFDRGAISDQIFGEIS